MMSGIRNAPPISMSSPRETIVSFRFDNALSNKKTAAALLFTTVAASAPVSSQSSSSTSSSRSPRLPSPRSYSSAHGSAAALAIAAITSSGMTARPKFVCSTVPVRLITRRRLGRARATKRASISACKDGSEGTASRSLEVIFLRISSKTRRIQRNNSSRPYVDIHSLADANSSSLSTEGSWASKTDTGARATD